MKGIEMLIQPDTGVTDCLDFVGHLVISTECRILDIDPVSVQ
jgi:hypothetical protein